MELNIRKNITGVYLLTCMKNQKKYVGASNNVKDRIYQHFSKLTCYKYSHLELYKDILKYGKDGFEFKLLEETSRADKLEKEQKWYDIISPEYNLVRPTSDMFNNPIVRKRSIEKSQSEENVKKRTELYRSDEYLEIFKTSNSRMKPVEMYKDEELIRVFVSIRSAARWLDLNTNFKGKNKASKVKMVCDNQRKSAFGYTFKYSTETVETILERSRGAIDTYSEAVN